MTGNNYGWVYVVSTTSCGWEIGLFNPLDLGHQVGKMLVTGCTQYRTFIHYIWCSSQQTVEWLTTPMNHSFFTEDMGAEVRLLTTWPASLQ